jgi:hypothetical protein
MRAKAGPREQLRGNGAQLNNRRAAAEPAARSRSANAS